MQSLKVSGVVRLICRSLGVKGLNDTNTHTHTHTHSVRHLWTSDQCVAETSLPDKYNIPNTHTYLHQKGFEPAFPASFRPQTDVSYLVATGTGSCGLISKFNKLIGKSVD